MQNLKKKRRRVSNRKDREHMARRSLVEGLFFKRFEWKRFAPRNNYGASVAFVVCTFYFRCPPSMPHEILFSESLGIEFAKLSSVLQDSYGIVRRIRRAPAKLALIFLRFIEANHRFLLKSLEVFLVEASH